jgi:septum formation protein
MAADRARLVLASVSPRRREILQAMGLDFEVLASGVDEARFRAMSPWPQAVAAARAKAEAVGRRRSNSWVLGCDTVVAIDRQALGQPADAAAAGAMLRRLSGRQHAVISAVAVKAPSGVFEGVGISQVCFRRLTDREIAAYIATGEPFGKAGAYAIQGAAGRFARLGRGRVDTVIGLPSRVVVRLLRSSGYPRFANLGRLDVRSR